MDIDQTCTISTLSMSLFIHRISFTKGIPRLSSADRAMVTIPDDIKDVLVGILLGDAHIVRRSSTANSRLVYAQTAVAHKEYFDYVLSFLLLFVLMIINLNLE